MTCGFSSSSSITSTVITATTVQAAATPNCCSGWDYHSYSYCTSRSFHSSRSSTLPAKPLSLLTTQLHLLRSAQFPSIILLCLMQGICTDVDIRRIINTSGVWKKNPRYISLAVAKNSANLRLRHLTRSKAEYCWHTMLPIPCSIMSQQIIRQCTCSTAGITTIVHVCTEHNLTTRTVWYHYW